MTDNGSLTTDDESDYYVFTAQTATQLHVSITDTETPACSLDSPDFGCGGASVELFDGRGDDLDEGTDQSVPQSGITVPRTFSTSVDAGTYYLVVSGTLGSDANENPTPVPYSVGVTASPNVQAPAVGPTPTPKPPPPAPTSGWHSPISHGAGPLGSATTAGADAGNEQFVFWRGTNGALWDEWFTGGRWHGPARIQTAGTSLTTAPAVAVRPSGEQDVLWKGARGDLWETRHTTRWLPAVDLGAGPLGSAPTAGTDAHGDEFVFWKGTDGSLWDKWLTHGTWHGPAKITAAGRIDSAPSVAVHASGEQDVFWRGLDGNLWDAWHTDRWHGPANLGGTPMGSGPSAGVDAKGEQFVFWEGTDGSLWDKWYVSRQWQGPVRIAAAGQMGSAPSVAVHRSGEQDVFWRGTDGNLWETWHP